MRKGELESRLLVLVTLGLVAFGLVMVYSATSAAAALGNADPSAYLKRQAAYAVLGVVLLTGASRLDYRKLKDLAPGLVLSSLGLCSLVLVAGTQVNGARRWLALGPAAFQPSELAKLALAVWAAAYLARRRAPQTLRELLRPIGLLAGIFCGLILLEPDLGTAIAIVVMLTAVLLVAGTPPRILAAGGGLACALGLAAIWLEPYRRARVFSFLHPWHDAQGAGFQTVQALIGLGSGGVFGDGLGQGIQKVNYLPEAHTDMIFAVVCGQAVINLAAVLGLAPLTGIPLPFVSYGGSSLVVQLASVGVLLNIAGGHAGTRRAAVPDRGRRDGRTRPAGARGRGGAARPRRERDVRRVP